MGGAKILKPFWATGCQVRTAVIEPIQLFQTILGTKLRFGGKLQEQLDSYFLPETEALEVPPFFLA